MTEATTDAAETASGDQEQATDEFMPVTSQADFDKRVGERVARVKAQFKDYADLKTKAAELDQIKAANQTEAERLTSEATRWQTEAEQWRGAAVGNRIHALASNEFADPTDAVTALADKNYLDAGGQIDEAAIVADLAAVLERKPHWRRPEGAAPVRVPAPNPAQGSGGGSVAAANPGAEFAALLQGQLNRS